MDRAIAGQPEATPTSDEIREPSTAQKVMTAVSCRACGANFIAPIEPRMVEAIRRCDLCGERALDVAE